VSLRHLRKLSLECLNSLDAAESRQLAEGAWEHLTSLTVSWCDLTAAAVQVLLSAPWAQQLKHLHLPKNRLGDTGLLYIAQAKLPQLQHLDLQENRLGTHATAWCLQQLNLPQLTHLNLSLNRIGEYGLAGLCLANLPQLRHLNVSETFTPHDSLDGLELLARGPWLQLEELAFREEEECVYGDLDESEGSTAVLEAAVPAEQVCARTSSLRLPPSLSKLTKLDIGGSRGMSLEAVNVFTGLGLTTLQQLNCNGAAFTKDSLPRLTAAPFPNLQLFEVRVYEEADGDVDLMLEDLRQSDLILALGKGSAWSGKVLVETSMGSYSIREIRKMAAGDVSILQEALDIYRAPWAQDPADEAGAAPPPAVDMNQEVPPAAVDINQEACSLSSVLQCLISYSGDVYGERLKRLIADLQKAAAEGSS
jgi:hypothetical protein